MSAPRFRRPARCPEVPRVPRCTPEAAIVRWPEDEFPHRLSMYNCPPTVKHAIPSPWSNVPVMTIQRGGPSDKLRNRRNQAEIPSASVPFMPKPFEKPGKKASNANLAHLPERKHGGRPGPRQSPCFEIARHHLKDQRHREIDSKRRQPGRPPCRDYGAIAGTPQVDRLPRLGPQLRAAYGAKSGNKSTPRAINRSQARATHRPPGRRGSNRKSP